MNKSYWIPLTLLAFFIWIMGAWTNFPSNNIEEIFVLAVVIAVGGMITIRIIYTINNLEEAKE